MPKFPLRSLVHCEWEDITTFNEGWRGTKSAAADAEPILVQTVGFVLEDTKKYLKLVMMQATTNDGEVGVVCVIPKANLVRSKVLKGLG